MIRSTKHLKGFKIEAKDGPLGTVKDFYFDDERWVIRWVVVDTGKWLPGRKVLVSPLTVSSVDWGQNRLVLSITKDVLENSPSIDSHLPVSRQHEMDYFNYFGYPYYWGQPGFWGVFTQPVLTHGEPPRDAFKGPDHERRAAIAKGDGHLRSCDHVQGYAIEARDGNLGQVKDFLFDDDSWAIRYMVVDAGTWWSGNHVLVAPEWITDISWERQLVQVELSREQLKRAPRYDRIEHLDRQWEAAYHSNLGRQPYWLAVDGSDKETP